MKRPPVFLESGGSCLSTMVLTISLICIFLMLLASPYKKTKRRTRKGS